MIMRNRERERGRERRERGRSRRERGRERGETGRVIQRHRVISRESRIERGWGRKHSEVGRGC